MRNSELSKNFNQKYLWIMSEENVNLREDTQHKIKTFAYQSYNNFHKSYKSWLTKYRERRDLWDVIKVGGLLTAALFFWFLFLYYINLASTEGYFMKLATYELNSSKEKSDIEKLEVIRKKKANRDQLSTPKSFSLQKNLITIEIPELSEDTNS